MTITRDTLNAIRADVDALLGALAPKYGLRTLKLGNCTFDPNGSFTFKLAGTAANGATPEEQRYDMARAAYGVLPERGTAAACIEWNGGTIELFGANSTLSKLMFRRDGKVYLTPTAALVTMLNRRTGVKS